MSMIKSPLRYPGGKSRAVQFLSDFIPPFEEFREVFFGGGSLSFYCIQKFADRKFIASDLNYELYCFWSQLKSNSESLIKEVQKIYNKYKPTKHSVANGKKLFNKLVERRNGNLTELERAVDFYILNRITFSGVVDSGGYSQGSFEKRFTQSSIDRLEPAASIIRNVDFNCENYSHLLSKKGKNVFLFLDPPYYTATKSKLYGKNGILHTQFNHEQLKKDLEKTHHKWLITYDNSSFIKDLYKDYCQQEWQLQYGMTNRESPPGNELLIANYDLHQARQSIEARVHLPEKFLFIRSFLIRMKYFKDIETVQLSKEVIEKARDFAEKVTPTTDYSDSRQFKREKVFNDHFISKLGEEAAKMVFSKYAEVKGPDYNIYEAGNKSWAADLFVNSVGLAVKTQKRSMASRYKLSWTFQHGKMRRDKIFHNPEAWVTFVEYDDTNNKNVCHVYPPFQLKELTFGEPALAQLKGEKKVIYAGTLKIG